MSDEIIDALQQGIPLNDIERGLELRDITTQTIKAGDLVLINSTPDLPTTLEGKGQVLATNIYRSKGFHRILTYKNGETAIFHESQLTPYTD